MLRLEQVPSERRQWPQPELAHGVVISKNIKIPGVHLFEERSGGGEHIQRQQRGIRQGHRSEALAYEDRVLGVCWGMFGRCLGNVLGDVWGLFL